MADVSRAVFGNGWVGSGAMGEYVRSHADGGAIPPAEDPVVLGAIETWPQSLKTALSILLNANCPMFLVWGGDRHWFHNDACAALGVEHSATLSCGQSLHLSRDKVWENTRADIEQVFATGHPLHREGGPFPMPQTGGFQTALTWAYSALWNERGQVAGVFATGCPRVGPSGHHQIPHRQSEGGPVVPFPPETAPPMPALGRPGAAIAQREDTDFQRTAEILHQREEELRLITHALPVLIAYVDKDHYYRFNNQTYETWFGQPASHFTGRHVREALGQEVYNLVLPYMQRVFSGQRVNFESQIAYQDGQLRYVSADYVPHVNRHGEVEGFFALVSDISDRKRAEESLRQSEERLRLAMEAAQMATWDIDLTTGKAIWSELHFTMLGYEPTPTGEASETLWASRIHPEDLESVLREWQQSHQELRCYRMEYRVIRADNGQVSWLAALGNFTYNSRGEAIRSIGVVFDVTERKQVEAALRESEARFRQMTDTAPMLVWMSGPDQRCCYFNQSWLRFTGRSLEQELGLGWADGVHPDDVQRCLETYTTAFETRRSFEIEYRLRRWDGEHRWVFDVGHPRFTPEGEFLGYIGSCFDIHDRRQAEADLRASEERYRYLAESIPQLVWTANAAGGLMDVNQRWSAFTGLTLDQARTDGWESIVHPDDVPILHQSWVKAQRDSTYYHAEGRMRRVDGTYRWHLHQAVPLKNEMGQVMQWFGTATDIEEQKQLEQQRSRMLQREQAARAEAERANRIKDEFLAVLSHELRSPLNPILGWARLLRQGKLDAAKTQQALATIERNAQLQSELIEDLLDVSRILQGKLRLAVAPVDLTTVIAAAIETVRLSAEARAIELRVEQAASPSGGPPDHPVACMVAGDSTRLQQIVWNLLSNGVKFTPSGGRVTVRLDQSQSQAQITVSDTGKGIAPDFLPHVFDYFRQEDGATTRQFGGLGLGLAIVRHLVELHGGTIAVHSAGEGQGATFTVCLPLLAPGGEGASGRDNPAALSPTTATPLRGWRILVVEDDPDTRELVVFLLEQAGATVTSAPSARDALSLLSQSPPDVLLSDIGMPGMDGYALMRQVRSLPPHRGGQVRAIALTAYAGEIDYQQALAVGFHHHLTKPIEPERLIQAIAQLGRL